jgi:uncharacterized protein
MVKSMSKLIIAGGSGFLGQSLIRAAGDRFSEIVILSRKPAGPTGCVRTVVWDPNSPGVWIHELDGAGAVVNLVGRTVDCIKTPENKRQIMQSRVESVMGLHRAIASVRKPPPVWIQSGTAHIFGDTHDEILDDASPIGTGFAPEVGVAWEQALYGTETPHTRKVNLRISFVLGANGGAPCGALARLTWLVKRFLGGTVGSGKQYISWIHERDLAHIMLRAIDDPRFIGNYVATAPNPVTNKVFMAELRRALHRPWSPPAPAMMVKFGARFILKTDPELALLGRRVVPTKLLNEGVGFKGFEFKFPHLREALADIF